MIYLRSFSRLSSIKSIIGASTSRHGDFNSDSPTWLHRLFKASKVNDIIRIYKSGENIAIRASLLLLENMVKPSQGSGIPPSTDER